MNKNEQLSLAIMVSAKAHYGQYDKGGKPYILHPLHLMNQLMYDKQLATIAILHDVVEDSEITIEALELYGFSPRVLSALILLTHDHGISYDDYINRICTSFDAIRVKRKDLEHNSQITRLKNRASETDIARVKKYQKAFVILTDAKRLFDRK